jgi:competence protein ComEC
MNLRPIFLLLFPFILGVLFSDEVSFSFSNLWILLITLLFLSTALFAVKSKPNSLVLVLVFFLFFAGLIRLQVQKEAFENQSVHHFLNEPIRADISGILISNPEVLHNGVRATISVDSLIIQNKNCFVQGNILLRWKKNLPFLQKGDRIVSSGTLTAADGERNPGEFNYRNYLKRKNIAGLFYVGKKDTIKIIEKNDQFILTRYLFDRPRKKISKIFEDFVSPFENIALLKGLILGLRGEINPETRVDFADSGVIHVLAVSGLHVGFVSLFLLGLSKLFRLPHFYRNIFIMFGLVYYAGLTGFKPPVVRAVIMADLFLLGIIIQRKSDVYNILAVAALLILVINPQSLFDVGFQLSFTAVFSIVFFYKKFHSKFIPKKLLEGTIFYKILRWPLELVLVSFCAQIGTLPLTAIYFDRIPLFSILANIVVIPLVMIVVFLGFILIPVAFIWSYLGTFVGMRISFLLDQLVRFISWFSSFQFIKIDVSHISVLEVFLIFGLFIFSVYEITKKKFGRIIIVMFVVINVVIWRPFFETKELQITFLDVGQGDACLIEIPNGKTVLIDTGPKNQNYDAGEQTIIPYLKRRNIKQLDAIFISHSHEDHSGGIESILLGLPVKKIVAVNFKQPEENYLSVCDSLNIPIHYVSAGDSLNFLQPLKLQVLSPFQFMINENSGFDENECSLVISIQHGNNLFLFCGDIEKRTENLLKDLSTYLDCDILKSPHHGSKTSNTFEFLKRTSPNYSIISAGKWNRFGHPSEIVLKRCREQNIQVVRTDKNGAVIFTSNGERLKRIR